MEELSRLLPEHRNIPQSRGKGLVPKDPEIIEDEEALSEESNSSSSGDERPRRRSRAALRGARIKRPSSKLRVVMIAILIVTSALAIGKGVTGHLRTNPRYRLSKIELRGQKYLGKSEVEEVFQSDKSHTIYAIPLEERRRQIEEIGWVHHASVTRVPPGEIWVRVEERKPLAFLWSPRGVSLIDSEGVVLDVPPETYFSLPVARGVTLREAEDSRRAKLEQLVKFLDAINTVAANGAEQISEVNLSDPRNVRAIVSEGDHSILLHFGDELFGQRFQTYQAHIAEWRRQFAEMQSIDLRYEGQAVIHSDGSQAVRIDNSGAKPSQAVQPSKPPVGAARASSTSREQLPADPQPPAQEAGMVPSWTR